MLDIDELHLAVEASAASDRAELLFRRVTQAVAERMPDALAALRAAADVDDGREIFVERLDVECAAASHWDPDGIARALAQGVQRALIAATTPHMVFRDRAEYVAGFMIARVDGVAGRRWWYDAFAGLEPLSVSNALRTVIIDEGEGGIAALARLTPNDATRVLAALNHTDACRVLDWLTCRPAVPPPVTVLWRATATLPHLEGDPGAWIATLIAAERAVPGAAGASALMLLQAFRALRERARREPAAFVMAADPRQTLTWWSAGGDLDARWVDALDSHDVAMICTDLAVAVDSAEHLGPENAAAPDADRFTRLGGAFVLGVVLARLGWIEAWRDASSAALAVARWPALAWLVIVKAAASPDALAEALDDRAVQMLAGTEGSGDPRRTLTSLPPAALGLLRAIPRDVVAEPQTIITLAGRGRRMLALLDARGRVTASDIATRAGAARLRRRVEPGYHREAAASGAPVGDDRLWWQREWQHCSASAGVGRGLEVATDVAALNLLRELGDRIPGCSGASPDYLRTNLLACPARISSDATTIRVALGRPPLDVLLALSGWKRCECMLPDGRRLVIGEAGG